jgi:integrase
VARLAHVKKRIGDERKQIIIVRDPGALLEKLRGDELFFPLATLGLYCGLRLGEALALRWRNAHLDGPNPRLKVVEALDDKGNFKPPKSASGVREISLPVIAIEALRQHRVAQLERRMKIGAGRLSDDDLLFSRVAGGPLCTTSASIGWGKKMDRLGEGQITFHSLRHWHGSWLISLGLPITAIARRLGHSSPKITLDVYAHALEAADSVVAAAMDAALKR